MIHKTLKLQNQSSFIYQFIEKKNTQKDIVQVLYNMVFSQRETPYLQHVYCSQKVYEQL